MKTLSTKTFARLQIAMTEWMAQNSPETFAQLEVGKIVNPTTRFTTQCLTMRMAQAAESVFISTMDALGIEGVRIKGPQTLDELHDLWLTFPASKRQEYSEALYEIVVGQAEFHKSEDGPYIENATLEQRLKALDVIENREDAKPGVWYAFLNPKAPNPPQGRWVKVRDKAGTEALSFYHPPSCAWTGLERNAKISVNDLIEWRLATEDELADL